MEINVFGKVINTCIECPFLQRRQEVCPYISSFSWRIGVESVQADCPFAVNLSHETLKELGFERSKLPYQFFNGIYKLIRLTDTKISITHVADDCFVFYGEIYNIENLKFILKLIS
jgi:hypothetical protein